MWRGIPGYRWSMYSFLRGPGFGAVALLVEPVAASALAKVSWMKRRRMCWISRCFLRIDEKLLLLPFNVVAEGGRGATVLAVPLGVASLSRMRLAMTSRSYCAKVIRVLTTEHRTCSHNPRNRSHRLNSLIWNGLTRPDEVWTKSRRNGEYGPNREWEAAKGGGQLDRWGMERE